MSLESLISSIASTETSSAGRFEMSFEMPYSQSRSLAEWAEDEQGTFAVLGHHVSLQIGESLESTLHRFLGCAMIYALPDEALEETLGSLANILDFYAEPTSTPALPAPMTAIEASVADPVDRPNLVISDES